MNSRTRARDAEDSDLHALVGRALSALSRDLYSGRDHLLAEMVQNADDAQYGPGIAPQLSVLLDADPRKSSVTFQSNETGFSAADVRAVSLTRLEPQRA